MCFLDGSKEWYDGAEKVCSVYCKELKTPRMTNKFARAARLRFLSDGDVYHELPTFEAQNQLFNLRQSPGRSVGDARNVKIVTNVAESRIDDIPDDDDDLDMEGAFLLDSMEPLAFKRRLETLQVSC